MIMGLERLDRITAFMEEQSGGPRRSVDPIHEEPEGEPAPRQERDDSAREQPSSSAVDSEKEPQGETAERRLTGLHYFGALGKCL